MIDTRENKKPTCKAFVFVAGLRDHRCGKPAKHDPVDGVPTKCGIHCQAAEDRKKAKSNARYDAWKQRFAANERLRAARVGLEKTIREIAKGHNDPRSLAIAAIAEFDEASAVMEEKQCVTFSSLITAS